MAESLGPRVWIYPSPSRLSQAVAERIALEAQTAVAERGRLTLAVSGGNTPRDAYRFLGDRYAETIAWAATHLFWVDERFVPSSRPESNFGMVKGTLLTNVSIPRDNIHRVNTAVATPGEAAASYETDLRKFFGHEAESNGFPAFDLVILGIGADGHTASLFTGDAALQERSRWVTAARAPSTYKTRDRITLTLPVLNAARTVIFLVSGVKKQPVIKRILKSGVRDRSYPAALVSANQVFWFLDKKAWDTA